MQFVYLVPLLLVSSVVAQGAQFVVAPSNLAGIDGPSRVWVPGGHKDLRQQTLVGSVHLAPVVGHQITGLMFRRNAVDVSYPGGAASMTVTLSSSPNVPLEASSTYAMNVGLDATQVFQGVVSIPSSPAVTGQVVPWTVDNTIHVAFSQPFPYFGGTLCVDITGFTVSGQVANRWLADAAYDYAIGTAVDIGPGCGSGANLLGQWSWVSPHTLLPGSTAHMWAHGPLGNWVVTATGPSGPAFPLSLLNLGQPGCNAYLSDIMFLGLSVFGPMGDPRLQGIGGEADYEMKIPLASWVLGAQMTTQWLDIVALNSSNAVTWAVAPAPPTLEMALVDGVANSPTGNVSVYLAHVMGFEYQ